MGIQHSPSVISGIKAHPRRYELLLMVVILIIAAGLRIIGLTRLPPGFSGDEIKNIQATVSVRMGTLSTFYNVGDPAGGYEGLYPVIEAGVTSLIGDGLLCYRILSLWCGLVSVALAYALTRRLFGRFAGLSAAAVLAISLWTIILSRSVIRETLLLPLMLAMLLALIHALHLSRTFSPDAPVTWSYTILGVIIAAMLYTHWTGLIAIPLFVLFLIYVLTTRQPISRRIISSSAFAAVVVIILCIPYLTFTLRSFSLSGLHVFWAGRPMNVLTLLESLFKTLLSIGISGDPQAQHNLASLPLIGPIAAILFLLGLGKAIGRWRAPNNGLIILALVIGLVPSVWSQNTPNFATMVVALPAIVTLIGLGAASVADLAWRAPRVIIERRVFVLGVATVVVTVAVAGWMLFDLWGNDSGVNVAFNARLGRLAAYLDRTNDSLTTSICTFNLYGNSEVSDPVLLGLMMHRRTANLRFSDCMSGLVLTGGGSQQRFAYAEAKAISVLPDYFKSWVHQGAPVNIAGLPTGSVVNLDVKKQLADMGGQLGLGHVWLTPDAVNTLPSAPLPVRMGDYLTFEGYNFPLGNAYHPGDTVTLLTYWRVDGPQQPDLQVFVHILRNPNTEPVLQDDALSVEASALKDEDIFIQVTTLELPPDFPEGQYQVSVGAYHNGTQARVPVYDVNNGITDRLFLDEITVKDQ